MFPEDIKAEQLNSFCEDCMIGYVGIEFTKVTKESVYARMPVDHRTKQPLGLLHGGASVMFAESMGSMASSLLLDPSKQYPVGLEINANHIKSANSGYVKGECSAIHIGKKTHVWSIRITNDKEELVCISRLTIAIIDRKS